MTFIVVTTILVIAVLGFLKWRQINKSAHAEWDKNGGGRAYDRPTPTMVPNMASGAFAFLLVAFVALSVLVVVPPGHEGVGVLFGKVQDKQYSEGLRVVNPLMDVTPMSFQTRTYDMHSGKETDGDSEGAITILTKDGLIIDADVTVAYNLVPKDAGFVFRIFTPRAYQHTLVMAPARTAVREAATEYTFNELYSDKREEAAEKMQRMLAARVEELIRSQDIASAHIGAIQIQQVMLRRLALPKAVTESIEAKQKAEQDAQRMQFVIQKERLEAERKSIEATGIKNFQDIVRQGIDPLLLAWKGVEATEKLAMSENSKIVIVGNPGNGLPLILGDLMSQLDEEARKRRVTIKDEDK